MKRWIGLTAAIVVAGCITTSRVVPIGKNVYMVTASSDTCENCTPPQIRAAERANAHCDAMGKTMVLQNSSNETFDLGFGHKTTITFQCVER